MMTRSSRKRGSSYSESTKYQIIRAVQSQEGRTGGQIAKSLGLQRTRVNGFLYGEGKTRFGLVNSNWRWYSGTNAASELIVSKKSQKAASNEVQIDKQSPNRWFWVAIILLGAWVLFLLGNQKPEGYKDQQQQGGVKKVLPVR
jgi:hypothetical protein